VGDIQLGVFMTGLKEVETLAKGQGNELKAGRRRFRFTRYERSSDVESVREQCELCERFCGALMTLDIIVT
jgi:hypothetical protein